MFLQNIVTHLPNCIMSHVERPKSLKDILQYSLWYSILIMSKIFLPFFLKFCSYYTFVVLK